MEPPSRPAPAELPAAKPDPHRWVDEHGDCLYRYTLVRVRTPEVAEDLVQETLLVAVRSQDKFAGRSSQRSWLVGILKNKIVDHYRKLGRETSFTDLEFLRDECSHKFVEQGFWNHELGPHEWRPEADEVMHKGEFWQTMRDCLSKLPRRCSGRVYDARDGRRAGQGSLPHAEHFREQLVGHVAPRAHGVTRVSGKQLVRQGKSVEKTLMRSPAIHSPRQSLSMESGWNCCLLPGRIRPIHCPRIEAND